MPFPDISSAPADEVRAWARELAEAVSWLEERLEELAAEGRARERALKQEAAAERARADALQRRVDELSRSRGKDSSNSSRPPSSDGPYRGSRGGSLRKPSGRRPGRQPGAPSWALRQVADPDEDIACAPAACWFCGTGLAAEPVAAEQRLQVFEPRPPPPPRVTQYRRQSKACPCCGRASTGAVPAGVTGRVQYGPLAHALTALVTCAHYVPVARAAGLVGALAGVKVSAGFAAAVRGRAAARLPPFMDRVRMLLASVPVLHADESPARAAGALRYLHVACTEFLTAMHVADRTGEGIDAGGVLPGYAGTLVRDGYGGYLHLTGAVHAWCGAHGLRDLQGLHGADPAGQAWAADMAGVLRGAHAAARTAHAAGEDRLSAGQHDQIRARYRAAVTAGIEANWACDTASRRDGLRLARRFGSYEDLILRFITDLAVPFTNNQAERDLRPLKVQQRASGGTWRTLLGLADFAIIRSYLSTAAKWDISPLDALTRLFTTGPWLPPAAEPA